MDIELKFGWTDSFVGQTFLGMVIMTGGWYPRTDDTPAPKLTVSKGSLPPGLEIKEEHPSVPYWGPVVTGTFTDKEPKTYTFTLRHSQGDKFVEKEASITTHPWQPPGAFRQVSSSGTGNCGLTTRGQVYCWGSGLLSATLSKSRNRPLEAPIPVPIDGVPRHPVQVSAGYYHACTLHMNRSVYCWGDNSKGQADPENAGQEITTPKKVAGLPNDIRRVAANKWLTCAAGKDVWCWGRSENVGVDTVKEHVKPHKLNINDDSHVVDLSVGEDHSCAAFASGNVWCWGENQYNQSGPSDNRQIYDPIKVNNTFGKAVRVSADWTHSCAVNTRKEVWCWGTDADGSFGDAAPDSDETSDPRRIPAAGSHVKDVVISRYSMCVLDYFGKVTCFGRDFTQDFSSSPEPKKHAAWQRGIKQLSHGAAPCAINTFGVVACGGYDGGGAAGQNSFNRRADVKPIKQFR